MVQLRLQGEVTHFATVSWPNGPAQKGDLILYNGEYYEIKHILHLVWSVEPEVSTSKKPQISGLTLIVNKFPIL